MIKNITVQLNEAGKIKIGRKGSMITSQAGKEFRPPEKLDHFQLVTTEKDESGDYLVDTVLENRIKEEGTGIVNDAGNLIGLPIRLLYNDTELNFPTRLASYVGGKLSCSGDGETATKRIDDFTKSHPCPCPRFDHGYAGKDKCKPMGVLSCIIDEAGLFGQAHKFRTTSMNSVKGILGGLELIRTATRGRISGLPLMLTLNAKSTQTPQGQNVTVYVVSVCYRGDMSALRKTAMALVKDEAHYMLSIESLEADAIKAIPEKTQVNEAEELEVAEEFYPESLPGADSESVKIISQTGVETETIDLTPEPLAGNEESDTIGETPVGPYKAVYEKLLIETDYKKAISLVKRLTKGNLVYFLTQEHPSIIIEDGAKKPELIEYCETVLVSLVGEVGVTDTEDHSMLGTVKSSPAYVAINGIPNADRVKFLNAVGEFFKPMPIDRTATRDILLAKVVAELERRIKADMKPQAGPAAQKEQSEVKEPEVENNIQEKEVEPEQSTELEPEESPLQAWDDSGLIEKPQLIQIVKLKKDMEMLGTLDVTKPEEWQENWISHFLDADGNPHVSAVKLSVDQGNALIEALKAADKIPF